MCCVVLGAWCLVGGLVCLARSVVSVGTYAVPVFGGTFFWEMEMERIGERIGWFGWLVDKSINLID